ncbi:MAG TPA: nucleotide disphospho-sugar-binding domain-containing protein [Amycolatopsis sp.]|jgi:UDP:flavonoid glycosyltransferase YjiC (YdhE family)|nr:nucleotide disphospho-sugar-binding domain-containing protein [Amycolatopsis sp.]
MRILFSALPAHSHITPSLPLAEAAVRAGHEVRYATGPDALRYVETAGIRAIPAGLTWAEALGRYTERYPAETLAGLDSVARLSHLGLHCMIEITGPAMAEELLPIARDWQPDLMVSTTAEISGELVAALTGVPHVVHGFGIPKTSTGAFAPFRPAIAQLHARWGVPPARTAACIESPYLDIWPSTLRLEAEDWYHPVMWAIRPENVLPVSMPRPEVLADLPYERTAYVTLGTTYNTTPGVLETLIEALSDESVNLVVTVGKNGDPDRFGPQPDHVRIEHFIPQAALLPHCDVVVCHAGAGTILGALAHGLPLVMTPFATDQHELAASVESGGAGISCAASAEAVRKAFRQVCADPSYRAAAIRAGEQIHSMPTPDEIVERLEKYLAEVG